MSRTRARSGSLALVAVVAVGLAMTIAATPAGAAPPAGPAPTGSAVSATAPTDAAQPAPVRAPGSVTLPAPSTGLRLAPDLAGKSGRVSVFVQLTGTGAADASADAEAAGKTAAAQVAAAKSARSAARTAAGNVFNGAKAIDRKATELFQVGNAIPGVAIDADMTAVEAIAQRPDVVQVYPIVSKHPLSANGSELTKVLATWQNTGNVGQGVRIGVIDTGIDYTHSDFGGPGTADAWNAAHTNSTDPNWRAGLTPLAAAKVAGGYDFVGDAYNADPTASDYQPVAHPDADPIDCEGHGSHVAGIAAGYGVNAGGSTFTGSYQGLDSTALNALKIPPGMAPRASIYALKVFGCTGDTEAVIPALDWALDPNGDGNFADHLDIVNLSLGADYATVDDPENLVVDNLAKHGVLPVIAAGNNGDLTDTAGAPGNAVRALAVASSVDDNVPLNKLAVTAPASVQGTAFGQVSTAYDWANKPAVAGEVVALSDSTNTDGCDPLSSADAAAVSGKVAWLTWDSNDATRRCGSAARAANVKAAGGIGAVFTGDVFPFGAGILGSPDIPVFQLTPDETARLAPTVGSGLQVAFGPDTAALSSLIDSSLTDMLSSFSSRGTHGSLGVVKPDLAAPGDSILSAGMGTGTDGVSLSGTSMATPNAAGIAALVVSKHPTWTVEQVKADLMNTANHDVHTGPNGGGIAYGPLRVGTGRIDAAGAVGNTILAYAKDNPGGVSVSFGPVEAPANRPTVVMSQRVVVANTGSAPATASLGYLSATDQPGVTFTVSPSTVRIKAGSSTTATVTMTIRTSQLRRDIDPTMAVDQVGLPRQFVAGASGWLTVSPQNSVAGQLRVPVYAAAKPVSQTRTIDTGGSARSRSLLITGRGVAQGSGPSAFNSLVSVMDLGATSPRLPKCTAKRLTGCTANETARSGDLQYVGAGAVKGESGGYADGWLYFGISSYADWATIGNTVVPYVDIDTTGDGIPDYEANVQNYPGTDVLLAFLFDLKTGSLVDLEPVNFNLGDVDTNVFDTNVLVIPVDPAAIGVTSNASSFPITYTVGTVSDYSNDPGGLVDEVGPVSFDAVHPHIAIDSPLYLDRAGTRIPFQLGARPRGQSTAKALVLHLQGASGQRADVVALPYR
ncbi:MAG: hypothetical protein BGO26_17250 [Actinobacteria bacterium 69-20]|nr:S8 family serine peptidase [Actinomycetota bacterium]OJV25888.1 MAG: hypothetical protein BGO26_17250 [Actinobacteria bacterium 69-20]